MASWRTGNPRYLTWAQMFAMSGLAQGVEAICTDLPGGGRVSRWYWDATAGQWRVYAPTVIAFNNALVDGLAQTANQYLAGLTAPIGILKGATFSYRFGLGKNGATDAYGTATINYMGTNGGVADTAVATTNISAVFTSAARSHGTELFYRMASATSVERQGTGAADLSSFANKPTATAPLTAVTIADVTTNAIVIGIGTTMGGSTNKPQIGPQSLIIHP